MADITNEDLIKHIEQMSVLELSELVKTLEDHFGVSAAMASPVAQAAGAPQAEATAAEEKTEFNVDLTDVGSQKIKVIKVVREVTNLGLKEAKDLVEGAPKTVRDSVSKEEAEEIRKKFEEVGAKIEIK